MLGARDGNGWTPVHIAFIGSKFLLRNWQSYNQLHPRISQRKYLHKHYADFMKAVLEKGFNVIEKDQHGASVVHYAAGTDMITALQLLLDQGYPGLVNQEDKFGSTPLHYAAFANNTDAVKCLLNKGCEKDKRDCKGRT
ncbi:hypothetical protein CAPTEDRAFT_99946, partial [Capitella teleta]